MPADGELMPAEEEKLYRFLLETWAVFDEKFHPGSDWLRPLYLLSPEEAAAYQERIGARRDARWMIVACRATADSENPDDGATGGGIQAVLPFADLDDLVNTPLSVLARKMALSIAARTFHDTLDWITLDEQLAVNPHGTPEEIEEAVAFVREYLGDGTAPPSPSSA